ncbi:MAG TPA: methyltransferase, partial [Methylomirabilota bacterium]|nr:methyltransferase [Methylomirabilota bacterium]
MFLEVSRNGEPSVGDLMRIRNSAFATDMFVAALGWLDLFTWLARNPSDAKAICQHFALAERPATSMLNLFDGWGLLRKTDGVYSVTNVTRTY